MTGKVAHSSAMLANAALVITFDQTEASHYKVWLSLLRGNFGDTPLVGERRVKPACCRE
jgi:hypothetical protein